MLLILCCLRWWGHPMHLWIQPPRGHHDFLRSMLVSEYSAISSKHYVVSALHIMCTFLLQCLAAYFVHAEPHLHPRPWHRDAVSMRGMRPTTKYRGWWQVCWHYTDTGCFQNHITSCLYLLGKRPRTSRGKSTWTTYGSSADRRQRSWKSLVISTLINSQGSNLSVSCRSYYEWICLLQYACRRTQRRSATTATATWAGTIQGTLSIRSTVVECCNHHHY